jgi:hypothetical protein
MHPAVIAFLADPIIAENDPAADMEKAFLLLDRQSIDNASARSLLKTFSWILAQQDRSTMQKLDAMCKLLAFAKSHEGCHCVIPSLRRFLDWPAQ